MLDGGCVPYDKVEFQRVTITQHSYTHTDTNIRYAHDERKHIDGNVSMATVVVMVFLLLLLCKRYYFHFLEFVWMVMMAV